MSLEELLSLAPVTTRQQYGIRDTILYALGVGEGMEPGRLGHVCEQGLSALPTMAVVLAAPGFWVQAPGLSIDWKRMLHAEQELVLHRPVPTEGRVFSETRFDALYDKGERTGALLCSSRRLYEEVTGEPIATLRQSLMLRGHGGFRERKDPTPRPPAMPARDPDVVLELATRPEQALIYRLSGDYNPLHCDPQFAREAGFPRPILHGLCTYGVAGRALLRAIVSRGATRLTRIDARFVNPVYPGETIRTQIWWEGAGAAFRCIVAERGIIAIDHGIADYS